MRRLRGGVPQCALAVGGSLCWGTGYALCWAGKWALAGAVTNNNVLADALHQAEVRTTADTWHGMELTWRNIFIFLYDTLNSHHLFWPALAVLAVLIALFILSIRSKTAMVCAAAHPQHPARLVYLACFGAYRLCRAGISLLRM